MRSIEPAQSWTANFNFNSDRLQPEWRNDGPGHIFFLRSLHFWRTLYRSWTLNRLNENSANSYDALSKRGWMEYAIIIKIDGDSCFWMWHVFYYFMQSHAFTCVYELNHWNPTKRCQHLMRKCESIYCKSHSSLCVPVCVCLCAEYTECWKCW